MSSQSTSPTYTIKPLTDEYVVQAAVLAASCIANDEPLCSTSGLSPPDMFFFCEYYAKIAARDGLGVVAVDNRSNMVIAAIICEDYVKGSIEGCPEIMEHYFGEGKGGFQHVLNLVDILHEDYWKGRDEEKKALFQPENIGQILHIYIGVAYPFARRGGVSSELTKYLLRNVRERGYTTAFTESTSAFSQGLRRKFGFETKNFVTYSDPNIQERFPYTKSVPEPHKTCNFMWNTDLKNTAILNDQ